MPFNPKYTADHFNAFGKDCLPGHLGIVVTELKENFISAEVAIARAHFAPNEYIHAGTIVALADTLAGYGCIANLPDGAVSFTTLELKSNFISSAKSGTIVCVATPDHAGKTTQIWQATVTHKETGKTMALFRCTQLIIYPKA